MMRRWLWATSCLLSAIPAFAAEARLAFRPAGPGLYEFDTGVLRGQLKLDGKYQGLYPLVDSVSGADLTRPPGVFSPYRVFSTNRRYGDAARDWPTRTRRLPEGGVEAFFAATDEHPLDMTAVYQWVAPDTLDFRVIVEPKQKMPSFELFMSNYFAQNFRAAVYVQREGRGSAVFAPADKKAGSPRSYVLFPRDAAAVSLVQDGRWKIPPSPVDWEIERPLAAPLAVRRDAALGITAVLMSLPQDCFAVATPWNPVTPDAKGYRSLYLSLFGRDLESGARAGARCRLLIRRRISDEEAVARYEKFRREAYSTLLAPGDPRAK